MIFWWLALYAALVVAAGLFAWASFVVAAAADAAERLERRPTSIITPTNTTTKRIAHAAQSGTSGSIVPPAGGRFRGKGSS